MDRRRFLSDSSRIAAAATGWTAASAAASRWSLASSPARTSANEKVVIGVIGVGGRGSGLMSWALDHPRVVVGSVCDVSDQRLAGAARAVAEKSGPRQTQAPARERDFRRVLDDRSLDGVIVATPHHWHGPIAVRALEAGKHVYVEKPASHVFREGRLLVEASRRSQRIVQQGTQMRSSEVTAAAAKVLSSGILGEIKMAKAWGVEPRAHHGPRPPDEPAPEWLDWDRWLGPAPERPFNPHRFTRWNSYREYGNGEIGGDGIHDIDLARWGLGASTHPVRITAHGSRVHLRGESDYPDNMVVTYEYADGKVLLYENRNFAPYGMHGWDNGNIFYGTEGFMVFSRRGYFQTFLGGKDEQGPGLRGGAGNVEHVHNFVDCVAGSAQPNADAETAHLSCALVHFGEIAYRTGRALRFDPKTETFPGDGEANELLSKRYRAPWGFDGA